MAAWMWIGLAGLLVVVASLFLVARTAPVALLRRVRSLSIALSGFSHKQVRVAEHHVAYCEAGRGEPVLLLHGFGASKDTWLSYARILAPTYRVLIPDLPGFGDSGFDAAQRYGYVEQVARVRAFVQALGLPKLHLVGNSMGGAIAGVYAATFPTEVRSLLLMDNGGIEMPNLSDFSRRLDAGENPLIVKNVADVDTLLDFSFYRKPALPGFAKRIFAADCAARLEANERTFQDILADGPALQPLLPKIDAPTLILWGAHDRVLDRSIVPVLERGLRKYETLVFEDCGHLPYLEAPRKSALAHLAFLQRLGPAKS